MEPGPDTESVATPPEETPAEEAPPPPRGPESPPKETPAERRGIIDAVADLLQFVVDWLRQEAEAAVRDKVVRPLQRLGLTLASGCAAALLAFLGIAYISVAVFMLLAQWLTYPGALLLMGGVLVLGSLVFTIIKMRSMQK